MTIWCGGMLRSIKRNAHAIAAAVTAIVIDGQWFSRRCLADIWSYVPLACFRYFGGEQQGVKEIITCQTCCASQQSPLWVCAVTRRRFPVGANPTRRCSSLGPFDPAPMLDRPGGIRRVVSHASPTGARHVDPSVTSTMRFAF